MAIKKADQLIERLANLFIRKSKEQRKLKARRKTEADKKWRIKLEKYKALCFNIVSVLTLILKNEFKANL